MPAPRFIPLFSNGLGVESVAILLLWLLEPSTRDFALEDLIVITAMVGAEWPDTIADFEKHILPLFRKHKVRFVQVGRGGHLEEDGIVVLDDSRCPERLYASGAYTLTTELETAGTVPQFGGEHRCSLKFKAFVIESWLEEYLSGLVRHSFGYNAEELDRIAKCNAAMDARLGGAFDCLPARVSFGYNAEELERIAKAQLYDRPLRISHFPLQQCGWKRQKCLDYIFEKLGVTWRKSACRYCPFARITADHIARQKQFPIDTGQAMFTERLSLAMNERGQLYSKEPLYQIVLNSGNTAAVEHFNSEMNGQPWAIYRVRRIIHATAVYEGEGKSRRLVGQDTTHKGRVDRCVEKLESFANSADAHARLRELADQYQVIPYKNHDLWYVPLQARQSSYPTTEEFMVACPAIVETKARYGVKHFEQKWADLADMYCGHGDLPLFASLDGQTAFNFSE